MKKLLVLTLVLGIASLATAGVDLATLAGIDYTVDQGAQTITITTTRDNTGFNLNLMPDLGMASAVVSPAYTTLADGGFWAGAGEGLVLVSAANTTAVTGEMVTISYTDASATVISIYDGIYGFSELFEPTGNLSLAGYDLVIPEPATMALLGLGALVLRRKK